MQVRIQQVSDVGRAVLAVRKASGVRQDDAAGSAGVSHVFLRELERGKETVQFGRVLQVLQELGIQMVLEIPSEARARFEALKAETVPGRSRRQSSTDTPEAP